MTAEHVTGRVGTGAPAVDGTDYVGAIYGSILAASVVAGASYGGPPRPVALVELLIATGLVFWVAHAYARTIGAPNRPTRNGWAELRAAAAQEWPLFAATVPPAAAAAICGLIGLGNAATAWLALAVAVGYQVAWAALAAHRAGASLRLTIGAAAVNLALGLVLVALKATLAH